MLANLHRPSLACPSPWAKGHKATKPTAAQTVINVLAAAAAVAAVLFHSRFPFAVSQFHSTVPFHIPFRSVASRRKICTQRNVRDGTQCRHDRETR